MFEFLFHLDYTNARDNNDYFHFGTVDVPIPSWADIIQEFNREYLIQLHNSEANLVKSYPDLGFVIHQCDSIPIVREFLHHLSSNHDKLNQIYTALAFISFTSAASTYGRHHDTMDVWYWQMTGFTLWQVEGRRKNFEKVLQPGELIYIPRGMWHNTKPITPRAGLSFGSEDRKDICLSQIE